MNINFQRVAIVNRGEAAMRFIHAAREFSLEHAVPLYTIALFTEPDRYATFVREADEAVCLGPAHFTDPETHCVKSTYLNYKILEQTLTAARADAVWVGWGFVAEHAAFVDLCREIGIVFIGPPGDVMRQLGDKIAAKRLAERSQIAVAPWSNGPVETLPDAQILAERLGFPLLIKATAGGGGHGIRRVYSASQLPHAFERARAEASKAFGDPTVFLEHLVEGARHIEVQIIADNYGTTWAVGVRDCTIQRRHQKVLEEAPSPALSPQQDRDLREAAVRLSQAAGYRNAGTVEFLYEPEARQFFFMEVNTRLQVEHPVTECTTGIDLVKLQIHVARGGRLEGDAPHTAGHAVEVRVNAEDPDNDFAPAPGVIERFRMVTGPGVRVDTGVTEGDCIPAEFDSMIAKVIGYGQTRKEALSRLRRALSESVIVVKGGASNKTFLLELLGRKEVQHADVTVSWLDRIAAESAHVCRAHADVALVQAAIDAYDAELAIEQAQFYASAARGRPQVRSEMGRVLALRYRGRLYSMKTNRVGPQDYRIEVDGMRILSHIDRLDQFECWLSIFGHRFHTVSVHQGIRSRIEVDGVCHQVDRDDGGVVHAPAPSVVVSIAVKPGDTVAVGDRLAVLEAMKMETQVVAPFSGKVRKVMTMPNVQVDAGAPLLQIETTSGDDLIAPQQRVLFGESFSTHENQDASCTATLNELRQVMLGFDLDPSENACQFAAWSQTCPVHCDEIANLEDEILHIFVDICSLFHREPEVNHRASGEEPSAESYLFSYLRMVETNGEGLPQAFVAALQSTLAHYGVRAIDSSPELKQSLLWICRSHQRMERQIPSVLDILERRLRHSKASGSVPSSSFRTLLDRMIAMTHELYPAVSDLAREVRYRYFDEPLFERARDQVFAEATNNLNYLQEHPDAADRRARLHALIECPQLLAGLFGARFPSADAALRSTMLEVLTWRYYRNCALLEAQSSFVDGHPYFSAEYDCEDANTHLFAAYAELPNLAAAAQALLPVIARVPCDHDVVMDFHVCHSGKLADPDSTEREVQAMLNQVVFPRPIRRIVVSVAGASQGSRGSALQHFTFQPNGNAYEEDHFFRGLHPMMGKRLHLWRLGNFKIDRLPSVEDVYLLHAVARDNPKDERLFAAAEVRDVTPVRDDTGRMYNCRIWNAC